MQESHEIKEGLYEIKEARNYNRNTGSMGRDYKGIWEGITRGLGGGGGGGGVWIAGEYGKGLQGD